jgi:hypothetical protein
MKRKFRRTSYLPFLLGFLALLLISSSRLIFPGNVTSEHNPNVPNPYPCPLATAELPPQVDPVISPTGLITQTITARFHNAEKMTVLSDTGSFSTNCSGLCQVTIFLKPNTTNNLTVVGKYREIVQGDCVYGGYSLSTDSDKDGNPLAIEQVNGTLYSLSLPILIR